MIEIDGDPAERFRESFRRHRAQLRKSLEENETLKMLREDVRQAEIERTLLLFDTEAKPAAQIRPTLRVTEGGKD